MSLVDTGTYLLPPNASPLTGGQDGVFYFVYYASLFFFVVITACIIYFSIKYRRKKTDDPNNIKTPHIAGNVKLEIFWSVVPSILFVIIFLWGFFTWVKLNVPPQNAMEVRVTGKKWDWLFTDMRTGAQTSDLIVPVNTPVKLIMSSTDVIHGFYVPDFRIHKDVLPSQYTVVWFQAPELGQHIIMCTQYCGTKHSQMNRYVKVVTQEEYEKAMVAAQGFGLSPIEYGKQVFDRQACASCHDVSSARARKIGPPLFGMYGKALTGIKFASNPTGQKAAKEMKTFDDNYIRTSVLDPNFREVGGYPNIMPSYQGQLNEKEMNALIDYIRSLK